MTNPEHPTKTAHSAEGVEMDFAIERDEAMQRDYIPLPGGWEVQTQGNGSTLRLLDKKAHERHPLPLPGHFIEFIERMAREVHAGVLAFGEAQRRKGVEWQPIEFAPKTGFIIAGNAEEGWAEQAWWDADEREWWAVNTHSTDAHGSPLYPTHYQLLPAPPANTETKP